MCISDDFVRIVGNHSPQIGNDLRGGIIAKGMTSLGVIHAEKKETVFDNKYKVIHSRDIIS